MAINYLFKFFQCGDRLLKSNSDVYWRQILTSKDRLYAEKVKETTNNKASAGNVYKFGVYILQVLTSKCGSNDQYQGLYCSSASHIPSAWSTTRTNHPYTV